MLSFLVGLLPQIMESVVITVSHFTSEKVALLEALGELGSQPFQLIHLNTQTRAALLVQPALKRGKSGVLLSPLIPVRLGLQPMLEPVNVCPVVHEHGPDCSKVFRVSALQ